MGALSRQLLVRVAFVIVVYILVEGVALAGLLLLRKTRGLTYFPAASKLYPVAEKTFDRFLAPGAKPAVIIDADLGWVRPPGPENNAAGMRDDRDHDPQPVAGILRIAAFGDSFTYGSDVKLGENWTKRISALDPKIEILNYGIGAYGLDQAYLRYLKLGTAYHPHVVLIGYMTQNLARDVNVYRGFYSKAWRDECRKRHVVEFLRVFLARLRASFARCFVCSG